MLPKTSLIKQAAAAVIMLGLTTAACNSKDYNEGSDTTLSSSTIVDTSSSEMITTSRTDTSVATAPTPMPDTSVATTATPKTTTGSAKPNPAKKGMKGKVSIAEPAKPTGAMQPDNMGVYSNVETMAMFPGGNKGLQNFFDKNMEYPEDASTDGVEGIVNVSFVVDENGKLVSPAVTTERMGYGLEEEALRVIKKMPNWTAAKLKGKNVKSRYTLPVRFELY